MKIDIITTIINYGLMMVRHSSAEIILVCSNPPCASSEGSFGGGSQVQTPPRRKKNSVSFFNSEAISHSASTGIVPYLVQGYLASHHPLRIGLTRVLRGVFHPFTSHNLFLLTNSFYCSNLESRTHKIPPLMVKILPCPVKIP